LSLFDDKSDESDNGNGNGGHDPNPDPGNSGYDGDSDSDPTQSSQGSNTNLGPESEHPATPGHMSDFGELLKGELRFRPRESGSGAVGTPKRGAAGNR
jgi:hypothetical protein